MSAYHNEIDPFCGQWLRNLIAANLIAPGEVDTRSIVDVRADDLKGFTQCHFFAGIGGWSYALRLAGWPDDRPVWTGSCPCQPFSAAGKQRGFDDERHLWPEFKRLIAERSPSIVFGEQVASATAWLRLVRSDLEAMDYAVGAIPFQAASAGADHLRDRFGFVAVADAGSGRLHGPSEGEIEFSRRTKIECACDPSDMGHADDTRPQGRPTVSERAGERIARQTGLADADWQRGQIHQDDRGSNQGSGPRQIAGPVGACDGAFDWVIGADGKARRVKPGIRLLVDAFPNRVGLLRGFGNAIDPQAFKEFIGAVMECMP